MASNSSATAPLHCPFQSQPGPRPPRVPPLHVRIRHRRSRSRHQQLLQGHSAADAFEDARNPLRIGVLGTLSTCTCSCGVVGPLGLLQIPPTCSWSWTPPAPFPPPYLPKRYQTTQLLSTVSGVWLFAPITTRKRKDIPLVCITLNFYSRWSKYTHLFVQIGNKFLRYIMQDN